MAEYTGSQPLLIEQTFGPSLPNAARLYLEGSVVDAERLVEQGMPIGRYPGITLRNAHLQYIVTWYVVLYTLVDVGIHWLLLLLGCVILCFEDRGQRMRREC